ncbi:MAG: choice-of-anchor D domain-containing protein [Deltaproteobacteria bacterium]|nr:choice-of-anchor D domain-containing protein [Deltaproteobacteria bacterium]
MSPLPTVLNVSPKPFSKRLSRCLRGLQAIAIAFAVNCGGSDDNRIDNTDASTALGDAATFGGEDSFAQDAPPSLDTGSPLPDMGLPASDDTGPDVQIETSDARADAPVARSLLLVPGALNLGAVSVGSNSGLVSLSVTNNGMALVGPFALTIAGEHKSDFAIAANGCIIALAAGKTCDISAVFKPSGAGERSAVLKLVDAYGTEELVTLTGRGNSPSALAWSSGTGMAFGNVITDTNGPTINFVVTNTGGDVTGVPTVAKDGDHPSDFNIVNSSCVAALRPNATCTISVQLKPLGLGERKARLLVSTLPGGMLTAELTGTGTVAPILTLSPTTHNFGTFAPGQSSDKKAFTVTASGAPADISTGAIVINVPAPFTLSSNECAAGLQGNGASCTFQVQLLNAELGDKMANLSASANTGSSTMATVTAKVTPSGGAGLVGYWPLDRDAQDMSGNGNHGVVVRGATNPQTVAGTFSYGKKDKALRLENPAPAASPTWVTIPSTSSINEIGANNKFTAMAWVAAASVDSQKFNFAINRRETDGFDLFGLGLYGGKPSAVVHFFFATAQTVSQGSWTHLATTYDGLTLTLYVNGVKASSMDIGWTLTAHTTETTIGARNSDLGAREVWDGSIDEVKLFSSVLTPAQIAAEAK